MYRYTQSWFLQSEIRRLLRLGDTVNTILEIGCFEGLSSVFFADNFLEHPNSSLTCVDPYLTVANDHSPFLQNKEENNFDYNISVCKHSDKITVYKITSDEFFKTNTKHYTFIYIDGCHDPEFIKRDMENAFQVLEKGGIMWMDDYLGGDGRQIKHTMDTFLIKYIGLYETIHVGYQLAIRKF